MKVVSARVEATEIQIFETYYHASQYLLTSRLNRSVQSSFYNRFDSSHRDVSPLEDLTH